MKLQVIAMPGAEACAARIAAKLGAASCALESRHFPDGESYLRVAGDVAGCDAKNPSYIAGTARKVKTITCKYDPSLSKDQNNAVKLVLKDGTLTGLINKDSSNIYTNLTYDKAFLAGLKD